MTMYRIRYSIYRINASDAHEAKRKAVELMQKRPQDWISVEPDVAYSIRPGVARIWCPTTWKEGMGSVAAWLVLFQVAGSG